MRQIVIEKSTLIPMKESHLTGCSLFLSPLGFYTGWLLPAAVVGVLVFMYGVMTMNSNTIAMETCDEVNPALPRQT